MQAVILAAGRGTRMGNFVKDRPKPMLKVAGKTLLEYKFDALPDDVDEIVLVVGYLAEVIHETYGESYNGKKITYVTQENNVGGTADALWSAKNVLKGRFLVMMGDDIYSREDIDAVRAGEWSLAVQPVENTKDGSSVVLGSDRRIVDIIESGYHEGGEGFRGTNLFSLDTRVFDFPQVPKGEGSTELGLPQTVLAAAKTSGIPFTAVDATHWIQITSPEDIARVTKELAGKN